MLAERLSDWARRTPDKTAIVYNGRPISYAGFVRLIAGACRDLERRGCSGPGYALLALHNLLDFWILSLALRSLGLTTAMSRVSAPLQLLDVLDVRCVVTTPEETKWSGLEGLCASAGVPFVSLAPRHEIPDASPGLSLPPTIGGHVLRTSGTTGQDKLVLMTPAMDGLFLRRKVAANRMDRDSVLCAFGFLPWSAAGYRWAASPWAVGATTLLEQGDKPYLALMRPGITHAVAVPAVLANLLGAPPGAYPRSETMRLAVGAGAMTRAQVEQAKARITPHVFNWLASTEAGGIAMTPLLTDDDHRWQQLIPDRVVEIVDDDGRPLPPGEVGRVRIGNDGGPASYLNDEEASRRFFADDFFYPGDLAVTRADGRLALRGRVTDVINVRGRKILPVIIEDRLADILGVTGVCLFSMQSDDGEENVHVVIEAPNPLPAAKLRPIFGQEFFGFPHVHIHHMPSLARNDMGKLLRQETRAKVLARLPSRRI